MTYLKFIFQVPEHLQDFFIAELMDLDFYGFEQFDNHLEAFVDRARFNDSNREFIEQMVSLYPGTSYSEAEPIEEQNWNETWERTIRPQKIGAFLVRPTWSAEPTEGDEILLEIDPKMAFGTGYHETTRLMLRQLSKLPLKDALVMDAGTGTGILAIAAVKLGARKSVGFDTDPWSKQNARENTYINEVDHAVEIRFGGIEQIRKEEHFDVSIANINRNVLLEIIPFLVEHTKSGGRICLSGLLQTDEETIRGKLSSQPVDVIDTQQENEWILFDMQKRACKSAATS